MNDQNFKKFCKQILNLENLRIFLMKSAKLIFSLLFNVYNENMFTIELEGGREAP